MLTKYAAARKDATAGYAPMQHRHFATIAAIIAKIPFNERRRAAMFTFADELAKTNPKFDAKRFIAACEQTRRDVHQ